MKVVMLDRKCGEIDELVRNIKAKKFLKKGYMCGIVNGLRIAKSIIESKEHELILERNENLESSRHDIEIATCDSGGFSALEFKDKELVRIERI